MEAELKNLKIDRSKRRSTEPSRWATRWILIGVTLFVLAGVGRFVYGMLNSETEVDVVRAVSVSPGSAAAQGSVILNATGYIVAHHKIQLASKVVGKIAWIGVDKGDRVTRGQVLVRLEDDEYRAQVQQAQGQLKSLEARLAELKNGSRPEEISRAVADVEQAKADATNAKTQLDRARVLSDEKVYARQQLDDAQAKYDAAIARLNSLERTAELVKIGPRREVIDSMHGQLEEVRGRLAFYNTQLANTAITAPVTGTILERNVEIGEFVTTGFVGDRGAKGYVVSIADLSDLQVELDINQNDFARLSPTQKGTITTDAFPDRKYNGIIDEIAPEANRQKATVQVKVKVLNPDEFLRPDMNASVAFLAESKPGSANPATPAKAAVYAPASAVVDGSVFVIIDGKVVKRGIRTGPKGPQGVRVESGLIGGEDLVNSPPPELKDGARVKPKKG